MTNKKQKLELKRIDQDKHPSNYARSVGSKQWEYVLIPHDEITDSNRPSDFFRYEVF
jgi:hypothetical protein